MILGTPPDRYDRNWFSRAFDRLSNDLRNRYSKAADLELGSNGLIITSPNGTRYKVEVDNSGTLSTTAI